MEIRVQSIRFDADQKLLDFIDRKLGKLSRFHDSVIGVEVRLSLLQEHDNKNVWVQVQVPGNDIVVERNAGRFPSPTGNSTRGVSDWERVQFFKYG
ncbi:MAG: HPF/RaiA family ribosome-associated protein [Candidatus Cryptobacteroides sp.]